MGNSGIGTNNFLKVAQPLKTEWEQKKNDEDGPGDISTQLRQYGKYTQYCGYYIVVRQCKKTADIESDKNEK